MNLYRECLISSPSIQQGANKFVATITRKYGPQRVQATEYRMIKCTWQLVYQTKEQFSHTISMLFLGHVSITTQTIKFSTYHVVSKNEAADIKKWTLIKNILTPLVQLATVAAAIAFGVSVVVLVASAVSMSPRAVAALPGFVAFCGVSGLILASGVFTRKRISGWGRPAETGDDLKDRAIALTGVFVIPQASSL